MRHVWIRIIGGLIWVTAAVISGFSGKYDLAGLYVVLGYVFLYSAYAAWKKEQDEKGGR